MEVSFYNHSSNYTIRNNYELIQWICKVANSYQKKIGEINYIFMTDEELLKINRQHLQHNFYTDIITFDNCIADQLNGEMYISTDRVKENAKSCNQSFERELYRVLIHGILHLVGLNDKSEEEKKEMREAEEIALSYLSGFQGFD